MGPHGICIGATGSGKSEMLRTLVPALALSHPPEDLSMVLVDYKGGAAFAPFTGLPHIAGISPPMASSSGTTRSALRAVPTMGSLVKVVNAPAAEQAAPKKAAYEWFHVQHRHQVV